MNKKNKEEIFNCFECKIKSDRDINGAINIL